MSTFALQAVLNSSDYDAAYYLCWTHLISTEPRQHWNYKSKAIKNPFYSSKRPLSVERKQQIPRLFLTCL